MKVSELIANNVLKDKTNVIIIENNQDIIFDYLVKNYWIDNGIYEGKGIFIPSNIGDYRVVGYYIDKRDDENFPIMEIYV